MIKGIKLLFFVVLVIFVAILLSCKSHAAGPASPIVRLKINDIEETENGFLVKGSVYANGPHNRTGIYDVYYL